MPKTMTAVRRSDDDIIATRSLKPGESGVWAPADGKVTIAKARSLYDAGLAEIATGRVGNVQQLFCILRKDPVEPRFYFRQSPNPRVSVQRAPWDE